MKRGEHSFFRGGEHSFFRVLADARQPFNLMAWARDDANLAALLPKPEPATRPVVANHNDEPELIDETKKQVAIQAWQSTPKGKGDISFFHLGLDLLKAGLSLAATEQIFTATSRLRSAGVEKGPSRPGQTNRHMAASKLSTQRIPSVPTPVKLFEEETEVGFFRRDAKASGATGRHGERLTVPGAGLGSAGHRFGSAANGMDKPPRIRSGNL